MKLLLNESMRLTRDETGHKPPSLWGVTFLTLGIFLLGPFLLGIVATIGVLIYMVLTKGSFESIMMSDTFGVVMMNLSFPVLLILLLIVNKYIYKKSVASLGFFKQGYVKKYAIGAGLGFGALIIVYLIDMLFQTLSLRVNPEFNILFFIAFLIAFMIQGMTEEVMCRGFLMNIFSSQKGVRTGIILNSLFFMILHGVNPGVNLLALLNIFIFGVAFSLLFYWSNNIWLTGAAHSFWNFTMGSILGVPVSGLNQEVSIFNTKLIESKSLINGGAFGLEGGITVTVIGIMMCVILWKLCQKKGLIVKRENTF